MKSYVLGVGVVLVFLLLSTSFIEFKGHPQHACATPEAGISAMASTDDGHSSDIKRARDLVRCAEESEMQLQRIAELQDRVGELEKQLSVGSNVLVSGSNKPQPKNEGRMCMPKVTGSRPAQMGQVTAATSFGAELSRLASLPQVKSILEIGTWYGGGSTYQLGKSMEASSPAGNCIPNSDNDSEKCCSRFIITMEIYQPAYDHARLFLQDLPIWCILGSSVNESMMLKPEDIEDKTGHFALYYQRDLELARSSKPMLEDIISKTKFDLILIDGNEYTGWGEYVVITKHYYPKYLALHDTYTLKTHKIQQYLATSSVYSVHSEDKDAVGWIVYKLNQ